MGSPLPHLFASALLFVVNIAVAEADNQDIRGVYNEAISVDDIDAVSAASEPPELFVEIISPTSGETIIAGSPIRAFGGPGWAIPSLELYVDDTLAVSSEDYNTEFETERSLEEGEHTFRVQFTCVLDSCAGQVASASVMLNVVRPQEDPVDPDPVDPDPVDPDPVDPDPIPDDPKQGDPFSASGCSVSSPLGMGSGLIFLLLLGFLVPRRRINSSQEPQ